MTRRKTPKREGAFSRYLIPLIRKVPVGLRVLASVFVLMILLLFLHSYIVSLNSEVRELQSQLDAVNAEIDSKNGRLLSSADLSVVEEQARALGMTEAQPGQYIYEAAAKKNTVFNDSPVGLFDYIDFFKQVRNERLWPQTN